MQSTITPLVNGNLPAEYRPTIGWKIFLGFCALSLIGFAVAMLWIPISDPDTRSNIILKTFFAFFSILGGAYMFLTMLRWRIVLHADRLEEIGALRTVTVRRDEIKGWRIVTGTTPSVLVLERNNASRGRKLKLGLFFRIDDLFSEWLGDAPDLDSKERDDTLHEVMHDQRFGQTKRERIDALAKANKAANVLNVIGGLLSVLGWFYPRPYFLITFALIVVPWVALTVVWRSNGIIRIDSRKNDPLPTAAYAVMGPSLILMLRAALDFKLLFSSQAVFWPVIITAVLSLLAFLGDPSTRERKGTFAALVLILCAYGYGSATVFNGFLDTTPPVTYNAIVKDMQIHRNKSTTYELTLSPWGPKTEVDTVDVGQDTYNRIRKGETVVITVHRGLLHILWYDVEPASIP